MACDASAYLLPYYLSKSKYYSKQYYLKYNAIYITNIILVEDIHNGSNKFYTFELNWPNKNDDRSKLDRRRLKAKREVALAMVTGNVFQTLIDLKQKLLAILLLRQKGFNRKGPVERDEIVEGFLYSKVVIKVYRN